jgi:hypothetical protein
MKRLLFFAISLLSLTPGRADAEADTFGLGAGTKPMPTPGAGNFFVNAYAVVTGAAGSPVTSISIGAVAPVTTA